ncbi:unnamed protein product [Moneuplotes crassus]|uniref:Uncharacterized protein n=1 Tax=Euplotes crassus TaxID=5936 RepID=A0AAD2D157_EUPCR|nr:unnamed protein product [Moneuplotes crassus]
MFLTFLIAVVMSKKSYLSKFRSSPDLDVDKFLHLLDKNRAKIEPLMQGLKLLVIGFQTYALPINAILRFINIFISLILNIFKCDTLICITPAMVLAKFFYEFRNFARSSITELDYGYYNLIYCYAKKLFGVISMVVRQEGLETYSKNSGCIRMRIGQYFMPTFEGNDTSHCSQFDDIIISLSEQPVDPSPDYRSLLLKLSMIVILLALNLVAFQLLVQEFEIFEDLCQVIQSSQPSQPLTMEFDSEACLIHHELRSMSMDSMQLPQIREELGESCSYDSEPCGSFRLKTKVRGSSAFILSDVASKDE